MQNSLAVISPSEWDTLQQQALALVNSGFLPKSVDTPQKAVAIMMLGRELGIPPWASLSTINVIGGKPTVSPQLMLALINRSGQLEDMTIADDGQRCEVGMIRKGRTSHSESFSMADAQRMQTTEWVNGNKRNIPLAEKYNWQQMPEIMRKWRAVAACARVVFPDVILGLYTPEEMGAEVVVDGEGNMQVVDAKTGEISAVKPAPHQPATQPPKNVPDRPVGAENSPLADTAPTETGKQEKDDFIDLFGPAVQGANVFVMNTDGDDLHLPRKDGLPILGSLDMLDIRKQAWNEKLVKGKEHFANLIDLLWREGSIRAASKPDAVLDAIRKHEAAKDLEREAKV